MDSLNQSIDILKALVRPERLEKIQKVIQTRTRNILPVLEGIFDQGNLNAVIRTSESLGFFEMHVIETQPHFKAANRVTQGADKWTTIQRWKSTPKCFESLQSRGYQVLATALSSTAKPIDEVDFSKPTALVFGNEKEGCSPEALASADGHVLIPMHGFSQSFNISVAAGISLYHAYRERLRHNQGFESDLSLSEQNELLFRYLFQSVDRAETILRSKGIHFTPSSYVSSSGVSSKTSTGVPSGLQFLDLS